MKKGWKTEPLGRLCEFIDRRGLTPEKLGSQFGSSGFRVISAKNVKGRQIDITVGEQRFVDRTTYRKWMKTPLWTDDVLLTSEAPLGEPAYVTEDLEWCLGQRLFGIRTNKSELFGRFLFHALQSSAVRGDLMARATGATAQGIRQSELRHVAIPVPPLTEQKRIVGVLDEVFAGIATLQVSAEKNLQNAHALFASHLQSVLLSKKWKWKTLGDVCESVEYGSSAKSKPTGNVPVLRMGNIQDGKLDWGKLVFTSDKEEIEKYLLKHNDVLFNRTNSPELVGKTAIYKSESPAIFAGYLIRIHRKEDLLDADYLNYFLNSQIAFDYGKTVVISSVNQANINGAKLKGYPIPLPSILEQRNIVTKLDALSEGTQRLARLYQRKHSALEALKQSLMNQAFTGKL